MVGARRGRDAETTRVCRRTRSGPSSEKGVQTKRAGRRTKAADEDAIIAATLETDAS